MTAALVGSWATAVGSGTTITATVPAGNQDDLIFLFCTAAVAGGSAATLTPSGGGASSYTQPSGARSVRVASGGSLDAYYGFATGTSGGTLSVGISPTAASACLAVGRFSGVHKLCTATGASTQVDSTASPTVTLTTGPLTQLLLVASAADSSQFPTVSGTWAQVPHFGTAGTDQVFDGEYRIDPGTGTTATWSQTASNSYTIAAAFTMPAWLGKALRMRQAVKRASFY